MSNSGTNERHAKQKQRNANKGTYYIIQRCAHQLKKSQKIPKTVPPATNYRGNSSPALNSYSLYYTFLNLTCEAVLWVGSPSWKSQ